MSISQTLFELAAKLAPDRHEEPLADAGVLGQPLARVDGVAKVTGAALFTADQRLPGLVHAALVHSRIAAGRIDGFVLEQALASPGVLGILTHLNAPRMANAPLLLDMKGASFTRLPVMQDDLVRWNGEPVAVVVAETLEQAEHAAQLVEVAYRPAPTHLGFDPARAIVPDDVLGQPPELRKGDAGTRLATAHASVDAVYRTPRYNHAAIELHATTCEWLDDARLSVHDCTQAVSLTQATLAKVFGLRKKNVRVQSRFVGGGFGNKMVWSHQILCAAAARLVRRPVSLVLSRRGVFQVTGGRTMSEQRVALGADADGRLAALTHTGITTTGMKNGFAEQFTFPSRQLYAMDSYDIRQQIIELDTVANASMRAPGESIGSFALESAMDELAERLGMDPIALRVRNEALEDPIKESAFSARHLVQAFERGGQLFGWRSGPRRPHTRREGRWWIGEGTASATYPYQRFPGAKVSLRLQADGQAILSTSAQEMGMGTATVQAQHLAARLGLPPASVHLEYGDSALPAAVPAGGSAQTASIVAAAIPAVHALFDKLVSLAGPESVLAGAKAEQLEGRNGGVFRKGSDRGELYQTILGRAGRRMLEVKATAPLPLEMMKYSMHSYGAHFCEVAVNALTGEVRVLRWTAVFDTGRILNPRTAASQFRGGIVMGIGMTLSEETLYDERSGRLMNPSMAEYHVPVHADIPQLQVDWLGIPDPQAPLGAKGVGEIGITGVAAAIANAVYDATGKRIRELPLTPDRVLAALAA